MNTIFSMNSYELEIRKLAKKQKEYDEIRKERKIAHDLSGDGWHDNPHFNRLQQIEASKNKEIKELKEQLENCKIIDLCTYTRPSNLVGIGSYVEIQIHYPSEDEVVKQQWEITCFGETNVKLNKLAYNTPLAQAIIGMEISDEAECYMPKGLALIEVLNISDQPL